MYAGSETVAYIPEGVEFRNENEEEEELIVLHLQTFGKNETGIQIETGALELEPLFRKLLEVWEEGEDTSYNRCMALLYTVFETLQRRKPADVPPIPKVIAPGVALLRRHYRDPGLTVAFLAGECFVSEVYFRRVYRAHFRESPLQTILQMRFEHACGLLRSGYYTPTQVAQLSGFSDVKYFRTAFSKRYGQTPTEYAAQK